jgi:hypothetical protein
VVEADAAAASGNGPNVRRSRSWQRPISRLATLFRALLHKKLTDLWARSEQRAYCSVSRTDRASDSRLVSS